ncbi:unnamed protein product [Staurois parvus]|uniref:Uncharacterized protein n=1 Tax=Staurois parvus TaxID=386267 RepID=A0ABN9ABJ7_9NEOB|nr:unnamed protein product [Staurois parvus]
MEASGGIGREGWRTLSGGQWRDWQRGVEDTETLEASGGIGREGWRTLMEASGGIGREEWRTLNGASGGIGREGWRTLRWRPVEGLAERSGGH